VQGYADDVVILIGGKFLSIIFDLIQGALNCAQSWCGGIRLYVNADKTSMITIFKKEGFVAPKSLNKLKKLNI
jgi:hypothetical protein